MLFVKRKHIPETSVKELLKLKENLHDRTCQRTDKDLGVGNYRFFLSYTSALEDKRERHWALDLALKPRQGFEKCTSMLLEKLPLANKTIIRRSCLHPASFREENFISSVRNLAKSLPNVNCRGKTWAA